MSKTLYFEGAGWAEYNGINCRIRTAFTNNDGKKIYIEFLCGHTPNKKTKTEYHFLHCDYCHYITNDPEIDDCNYSRLKCERKDTRHIEYTDEFNYNEELTIKRRAKVEELKKHFTNLFNQKYDNTSYYINKNNELEVRINVSEEKRIAAGYTNRTFTVEV